MSSLRDHLLDAYDGYADKRVKNRSFDRPIKINDKGSHDVYPYYCSIFVRVPDRAGEALTLTLQHCPHNPDLIALVKKHGGTAITSDHGCDIRLNLNVNQISTVTSLAIAISTVTKRGSRYPNPNWKWICPRTVGSLRRLAKVLKDYKVHRSQMMPRPSAKDRGSSIARTQNIKALSCLVPALRCLEEPIMVLQKNWGHRSHVPGSTSLSGPPVGQPDDHEHEPATRFTPRYAKDESSSFSVLVDFWIPSEQSGFTQGIQMKM